MIRRPTIVHSDHAPLRGVNLGGWLVLEKWMTPSLFAGTSAIDEYTFCQTATPAGIDKLTEFRDTFITEADFRWLKGQGIEAVRLPVGYWLFGNEAPYQPTVKYVDKAFVWAAKHGLKILLDLHAVPGSQNGWDHSGRAGAVGWHTDQQNIDKTLGVITRLVERYGQRRQLLGIELLNEPRPIVPKLKLLEYYEAAYGIIRAACGPEVWIVFHDNFRPRRWHRELRGPKYQNVFIDTHRYQCFSMREKRRDIVWHLKKATRSVPKSLARLARWHPVIVGEWSLALDRATTGRLNPEQAGALNRAYGGAQLLAFSHARAWFFWSYKTENSPTWSFREAVERHWLPIHHEMDKN